MEESRTRKKWSKKLGIACGLFLVALVAVYFVGTSAWCLKRVILPRVSKAVRANITVEGASLSLFSSVSLSGLKVQTTGAEPLFSAKHLLARYSLMAILRGKIKVDEVTVSDPVVRVVINADGTSNLDPFSETKAEEKQPLPAKPGALQVEVKKFAIENALVSFTEWQRDGKKLAGEVSGLSFAGSGLNSGQPAKLSPAGKVGPTTSDTTSGLIKLTVESLDLTPYYDLFVADKQTNAPAAGGGAGAPAETEPAAIKLPLRDFTFETEIRKLVLRGIVITNFVSKTTIDEGKVSVNSFRLALNGAPVSGKIAMDLGWPGYQYEVNFTAEKVPLGPLVDSFQPARKGQIGGTITALVQVKGSGVTGASLQKNLSGQFDIATTNLNLQVVNVKSSVMKSLLNVIIGIPDLIRNPTAKLGRFLGSLTGSGRQASGGWVDEVSKSPINTVSMRGKVGGGKVELERTAVQSAAFLAGAHGTITLEGVLTNSTMQIPIEVALRRGLAEQVGLAGNTPANADYAKLPDFVTMTGTVGNPKQDIKYGVLAGVALRAGTGIIGNTGGAAAGKITGFIGSLFGGGTHAAASTTNAGTTSVTPDSSGTSPRNTTRK